MSSGGGVVGSQPARRSLRGSPIVWVGLALTALWLVWAVPLAVEARTLFLRDVVTGALPLKHYGAAQLGEGEVPVFNARRGLGQPHSGNPNTLPFYPGNLLFLVLPFWSAFNLHYALHLLLACLTMTALCRRLGLGREAALLGGVTYAGSGWVLSCLTFYNILTVAAWWPLALLGAAVSDRRGTLIGGLAVGLAVLGGEPLTVAIGLAPLIWLAVDRHGWWRGIGRIGLIGGMALLVALPQLIATLRIFDFTVRGGPGLPPSRPGIRAFHPLRLLELLIPFPFGEPGDFGPRRFWRFAALPTVPYFYTVHFGVVGIWLATQGARRRRGWIGWAIAGAAFAWLGGVWPSVVEQGSAGLFRYSEKFLFWPVLAVPILAAHGLERALSRPRGRMALSAWLLAAGLTSAALVLWLLGPSLVTATAEHAAVGAASTQDSAAVTASLEAHLEIWLAGLVIGGAALFGSVLAARYDSAVGIIAMQILCLLQLHPLVQTMPLRDLTRPSPWLEDLPAGAAIHNGFLTATAWQPQPDYQLDRFHERTIVPVRASELDPAFGLTYGLRYPLAEDFEGIYSPLSAYVLQHLESASWQQRIGWSRALGIEYVLLVEDPGVEGLDLVTSRERYGVETLLYAVADPAPLAWWPDSLVAAESVTAALDRVGLAPDPWRHVVVTEELSHRSGARVEVLEAEPDRWRIEIEGEGGLLVLRRAFQPLLQAYAADHRLRTRPANLSLLGVEVPPGRHVVTVRAIRWPETTSWIVSWVVIAAAVVVGRRR